jgi:tyrosyl-tRNA synthetase
MWRYWLLLTDVAVAEIEAMKRREPMQVKKELAARIVTDYHSAADARQAGEDFAREVQQGGVPSDIQTVALAADAVSERGISVPKMLVSSGLAPSRTEAERLLKSGAVEINGAACTDTYYAGGGALTVRAGKKWRRVQAG